MTIRTMILRFMSWLDKTPADAGRFEVRPVGSGPFWFWRHVAHNGAVTMLSSTYFRNPEEAQRDIRAVRSRAEARVSVSEIPTIYTKVGGP